MNGLKAKTSKDCSNYSAYLQASLFMLYFVSGASGQATCSRANCASCGTVGPCSQCSKGYTLDKGGCKAMTSQPGEEQEVDTFLLILGIIGGLILLGICFWIGTCCVKKKNEQNKLKPTGSVNNTNLNTTKNLPSMQQAQLYQDRVL